MFAVVELKVFAEDLVSGLKSTVFNIGYRNNSHFLNFHDNCGHFDLQICQIKTFLVHLSFELLDLISFLGLKLKFCLQTSRCIILCNLLKFVFKFFEQLSEFTPKCFHLAIDFKSHDFQIMIKVVDVTHLRRNRDAFLILGPDHSIVPNRIFCTLNIELFFSVGFFPLISFFLGDETRLKLELIELFT